MPPKLTSPVSNAVWELTPEYKATAAIGGSIARELDEVRARALDDLWISVIHPEPDPPPAPPQPPPPPLPEQLGPFNWNPIVFGDGVPVGGWAQLTLFRSGVVNFSGHLHDSGAASYDMSCVFVVRSADGVAYTFSHRGRVHGTFEAGSRDDDWGDNPTLPAVAEGWARLAESPSWQARAGANVDIGQLVDEAVKAVGNVAKVIALI